MARKDGTRRVETSTAFTPQAFLDSARLATDATEYERGESVFKQGEPCDAILYIQSGGVELSVLSTTGKEAVVAMLEAGDFFGEGCLAGQSIRMGSATAVAPSLILSVAKDTMIRLLHEEHEISSRFIAHLLARNIRSEADLMDQLFNSTEKRLARTLLVLARYGHQDKPVRALPKLSQETLAKMVGTTRSRVNFFLNKFKKLGFVEYDGELKVHSSLVTVVRHEWRDRQPHS
jgi:CRP/FNR family cyclic AMP-dependent transcriptional regulator